MLAKFKNISKSALNEVLSFMKTEREGYYSTPHGTTKLTKVHQQDFLHKSFPRMKDGGVYAGVTVNSGGDAVYISCGGNWVAVINGSLYVGGRRHGVCRFIPQSVRDDSKVTWNYLETQEPGLAPWQTLEDDQGLAPVIQAVRQGNSLKLLSAAFTREELWRVRNVGRN